MKKCLLFLMSCVIIINTGYMHGMEEETQKKQDNLNRQHINIQRINTKRKNLKFIQKLRSEKDSSLEWNSWTGLKGPRYFFAAVFTYFSGALLKDTYTSVWSWDWNKNSAGTLITAALAVACGYTTLHLIQDVSKSKLQEMEDDFAQTEADYKSLEESEQKEEKEQKS